MRRRDWLRAVGVASGVGIAGCSEESPDDVGPIVPVTNPGNHPFSYVTDDELVGFEVDVAEQVIDRTPHSADEWVRNDQRVMTNETVRGRTDLIAATKRVGREFTSLASTDRYYRLDQTVLVDRDRSDDPDALRHLRGDTVGVRVGAAGEAQIRQLLELGEIDPGDFMQFDTYPLAVESLRAGVIDALIADRAVGRTLVDRRPVRAAFHVETGEGFGFLMRDDDRRLEAVDEAVQSFRGTEPYDELVAEWIVPHDWCCADGE